MAAMALTIGTFDGAHLGHAAVLAALRRAVGASNRVVALAFDPHPASVLRPGAAPRRLTTASQREEALRALGADQVEILTPEPALLSQPPEEFIRSVLRRHAFEVIAEGPDFRFGRGRQGDLDLLRQLGSSLGFEVIEVPPVEAVLVDRTVVAVRSTVVRALVDAGRMTDAAICLGRPYELECRVVRGDQRGRTIGYPTVNLEHGDRQLPGDGVYVGEATLPDGAVLPAAISVGTKPTFGDHARTCEAHLLEWNGPLDRYGWTIRLRVGRRIRDQLRLSNVAELLARMARDVEIVRESTRQR